jgi:hypothetical protein
VHLTLRPPLTPGRQHAIANSPSMDNGMGLLLLEAPPAGSHTEADHGQRRGLNAGWDHWGRPVRPLDGRRYTCLHGSCHGRGSVMQHKRTSWHHLDYLGGSGRIRTRNLSSNCAWHSYGSSQLGEVGSVTLCFPSERPNQKRRVERVEYVVDNGPDAYPSNPIRPIQ